MFWTRIHDPQISNQIDAAEPEYLWAEAKHAESISMYLNMVGSLK